MSNVWYSASGTSNILKPTYINGFLDISSVFLTRNDASMSGNVFIGGASGVNINKSMTMGGVINQLSNTPLIGNVVTIGGNVFNDAYLNGRLYVYYDSNINGRLFALNDISFLANLFVQGKTIINTDISSNIRLYVGNDVSLNNRLYVAKDASFGGNINIIANETVSGLTTLIGGLVVGNSTIVSDSSLNGRLYVGNDVSLNNRLWVSKDASFGGNVNILGNLNIAGSGGAGAHSINGSITFGNSTIIGTSIIQGNESITGSETVNGLTTLIGGLIVGNSTIISDASLNGRLYIRNDVSLNNRLWVVSDASFGGSVNVTKDLNVLGNLKVKQYTTNLTVYTVDYQFIVAQDMSLNGRLFITDDASMNKRLFIGGDVSMGSKLFVSGDTTVNGNLNVGGTINATTISSSTMVTTQTRSDNSTKIASTAYTTDYVTATIPPELAISRYSSGKVIKSLSYGSHNGDTLLVTNTAAAMTNIFRVDYVPVSSTSWIYVTFDVQYVRIIGWGVDKYAGQMQIGVNSGATTLIAKKNMYFLEATAFYSTSALDTSSFLRSGLNAFPLIGVYKNTYSSGNTINIYIQFGVDGAIGVAGDDQFTISNPFSCIVQEIQR